MHWFAAKLFLESFSVGLFSKHEHPIVLILPGDGVTVARGGKFTLPAEVPELVVVLPDALVFVERYPETGSFDPPRGVCAVGVATISLETPLARAVDSVVSAWISNPPRAGPYRPRSPASVPCNQETGP
jgi:hypothetical protein